MTQVHDEQVAPPSVPEEITEASAAVAEPAAEEAPQPAPYEMRSVRMHLRYNYTNAEKLDIADKMAEAQKQIGYIEDEKKRANTQFKSRLEMATAERDEMMDRIQTGYEVREVSCTVTANYPEAGMKTTRRSDTGEVVKVEAMTDGERQMSLPGIPADTTPDEDESEAGDDDADDEGDQPQVEACDTIAVVVEKPTPSPRRRASRMGVVACPSDGDDIDDPEHNKPL